MIINALVVLKGQLPSTGSQVADSEWPSDMEVSCEYPNKQSPTKSRVALWQGIVPGSHPARETVKTLAAGCRIIEKADTEILVYWRNNVDADNMDKHIQVN